jgi:hypothetical protein
MLGRFNVPVDLLSRQTGDSGKKGRMIMSAAACV